MFWKLAIVGAVCALALALLPVTHGQQNQIEKLIRDLEASEVLVRRDAAYNLSRLGTEAREAVPALIKALDDPEQQVWFGAVTALSRIGPDAEGAIPKLMEGLDGRNAQGWRRVYDRQVWYRSSYALSQIGAEAVPSLLEALNSDVESVRAGAVKALGWMENQPETVMAILIERLGDPGAEVRSEAAEALGRIGKPAFPALVEALESSDPKVRQHAASALAWFGSDAQGAVDSLLKLASDDPDPLVRAEAINALVRVPGTAPELLPALRDGLLHESSELKQSAISALLRLAPNHPPIISGMAELLSAEDLLSASRAAYVLGRIGSEAIGSVPAIIAALERFGEEPPVVPFSDALIEIGPEAAPHILAALTKKNIEEISGEHWSIRTLRAYEKQIVPHLIQALESGSPSQRYAAVLVLRETGAGVKEAVTPLANLLSDPNPELRSGALLALNAVRVRSPEIVPQLSNALADDADRVREAAAIALAELGPAAAPAIPALARAAKDPNPAVRVASVRALSGSGKEAASAIVDLLIEIDTAEPAIRREIIAAVAEMGSAASAAVPKLMDLAKNQPELRAEIFEAFGQIGPSAKGAMDLLQEELGAPDANVRASAVVALTQIATDLSAIIPALEKAIADESEDVRHPAARALGKLGPKARATAPGLFAMLNNAGDRAVAIEALRKIEPDSVEHLVEALSNEDPSVRMFASETLGRLGANAADAIPAFQKALENENYDFVRVQLQEALAKIENTGAGGTASE